MVEFLAQQNTSCYELITTRITFWKGDCVIDLLTDRPTDRLAGWLDDWLWIEQNKLMELIFVECGRQTTELNGTLSSPGYPSNYPSNADCIWVISAPSGHYIELTFKVFDIYKEGRGCRYDYVEIRDGNSRDSPSLGRHCGRTGK